MNSAQVIPFQFEANEVRTMLIDDQPWFVAADVCQALAVRNNRDALSRLDDDEKGVATTDTLGGSQVVGIINESGLYSLILTSRKAEAKRFKKWITAEVLPAIRRTGQYHDTSNKMATLIDALIGMTEVNVIKGLIRDKAKVVPADRRRSFQHTMHNRLHTRFNVPRLELIPAQQFEAACNFVAAYALEGEWLPKDEPKKTVTLNYPVEELAKRRPAMLVEKAGERTWLDVTLHDLRDIRGMPTPCEAILYELQKHGFDIEGAWWELRTYRNKLSGLEARIKGLCVELEEPHRYAV
ncbi:BRO-N domain-containing protein [Aquipseudomonas campi]